MKLALTPEERALQTEVRAFLAKNPTGAGAPVSGSAPEAAFGKAITSRIESVPDSRAQIRSQPKAIPPCGGAP